MSCSPTNVETAAFSSQPIPSPAARVLTANPLGPPTGVVDFQVQASAAVLVFASLVYPGTGAMTARLASFSTLPIALFVRPPGAVVSGHFEDRLGRKATLVAALRRWGSTLVIGPPPITGSALPGICRRFDQRVGRGGEWADGRDRPRGQKQLARHVPAAGPVPVVGSGPGLVQFMPEVRLPGWGVTAGDLGGAYRSLPWRS